MEADWLVQLASPEILVLPVILEPRESLDAPEQLDCLDCPVTLG